MGRQLFSAAAAEATAFRWRPAVQVSSANAMLNTLKALDETGFTVHGFRSSFEDWGAEATHFPRKLRFHNDPHSFRSREPSGNCEKFSANLRPLASERRRARIWRTRPRP